MSINTELVVSSVKHKKYYRIHVFEHNMQVMQINLIDLLLEYNYNNMLELPNMQQ